MPTRIRDQQHPPVIVQNKQKVDEDGTDVFQEW